MSDTESAPAIAWALDHAPGEIIVLRPGSDAPARRRIPRWDMTSWKVYSMPARESG